MNPSAIYSKTGKGVQEASGKTSQLSRGDRAILAAIDGKTSLKELSAKFDRAPDDKFFSLIRKLDADGFIREVSPGMAERGAARVSKPAASAPAAPAAAPKAAGEDLDFTQIFSAPPKMEKPAAAGGDPMAAAREAAEARARAEREAKAKAEAAAKANIDSTQKFRLDAEARAKAARETAMQAAAEGKTKAEIEARTRAEAEAKVRAAEEARARAEAEVRAKALAALEAQERVEREAREAKQRAERELREKGEAAERARFEAAERARREAEDLRFKVEEERRAREEAERRAREEAERTKREAAERARREGEEKKAREEAEALRKKLEEERRAREEAERKAEEERQKRDRVRLAELQKIQEEEERRQREDEAARKAREAEERREAEEHQRQIRLAREAEDKKRRDADARKKKEEESRRWEQEEARRKSDDAYRQRAEQEDKERAEREVVEAAERAEAEKKAAAAADALAGSLMADLDSFSKREEEERKEKQEQEKKEREERLRRAQEEEAQREREESERKARKAEEKRRREEEELKRKEEEERVAREAEAKQKEEEEQKRKEREEKARRKDDIPITSSDLGRDDITDEERKLTPEARKALRDREREVKRLRARGDVPSAKAATAYKRKQPIKWGKPVALALFFLLLGGIGVVNFLPLSTVEYERLASDALGAPVKIGSARMWVLAGVQIRFERVQVGETIRIAEVRAVPELAALLNDRKAFSRVEIDKLSLPQAALGGALFGVMKSDRLRVARVVAKDLKLEGPLALPVIDVDVQIGSDGRVLSVQLAGERTGGQLTSRGEGLAFEVTLGNLTLPFQEKLAITDFGMKGTADRQGMTLTEFDGRLYDGTVVGKARLQWGAQWSLQGEVQGRTMNAAVFAPQLVSEGRFEGRGRFALAAPEPAKLGEGSAAGRHLQRDQGRAGQFRPVARAAVHQRAGERAHAVLRARGQRCARQRRARISRPQARLRHPACHGLAGRGPRWRALRAHQRRAAQPARHLLHRRQAAGPAVEEVSAKAPPVPRRPGAAGIPARQAPSPAAVRPSGHPRPHGRVPPFRRGRGGAGRGGGEAACAAPAVRRCAAGNAARGYPVPRRSPHRHHLALVVQGDRHRAQLRPGQGEAHRARYRPLRARWRAQRASGGAAARPHDRDGALFVRGRGATVPARGAALP